MRKFFGYILLFAGVATLFFSDVVFEIFTDVSYLFGRDFTLLSALSDTAISFVTYALGIVLAGFGLFIGKIDLPEKKKN